MRIALLFTILLISFQVPIKNKHFLKRINSAIRSEVKDGRGNYNLRKNLIEMDSLDVFINSDTLFILESFDIVTAIYYGEMWNKDRHISYTREVGGKITFDGFDMIDGHNFYDYMRNLISRWDVSAIRQIDEKRGLQLDSWPIIGIRVIINKGRIKVDSITFDDFPDPLLIPPPSRAKPS